MMIDFVFAIVARKVEIYTSRVLICMAIGLVDKGINCVHESQRSMFHCLIMLKEDFCCVGYSSVSYIVRWLFLLKCNVVL